MEHDLPKQGKNEHDGTVDGKESWQPHSRFQLVTQQELLQHINLITNIPTWTGKNS